MKNYNKAFYLWKYLSPFERLITILVNIIIITFIVINVFFKFIEIDTSYNIYISLIAIFIGFNITFLSIMTLSKYSKTLYNKEINMHGISTNLLNVMMMYYKSQVYYSFFMMIGLFIVYHINFAGIVWDSIFLLLISNWFAITGLTLKYTFAFIIKAVKFE